MNQDQIVLEAKALGHFYHPQEMVLKNIHFRLGLGQSLGIIGPNGGGKSTLMKIIVGLIDPCEGELYVKGEKVHKHHFPHQVFAYVPQASSIDSVLPLKVEDIIRLGLINCPSQNEAFSMQDILKTVGLEGKGHYRFSTLSGGERQRTLVARALVKSPQIMALDEPTNGLDSAGEDLLLALLSKIQKEYKTSLVIVGHHIGQMAKFCDRILCLNRTHHWHDRKEMLTPKVIESIYHCEFEHSLIHRQQGPSAVNHTACDGDHHHPPHHKEEK